MQNIFYFTLKLELTFVELIFSYKSLLNFIFCSSVFLLNHPREYPNFVIF